MTLGPRPYSAQDSKFAIQSDSSLIPNTTKSAAIRGLLYRTFGIGCSQTRQSEGLSNLSLLAYVFVLATGSSCISHKPFLGLICSASCFSSFLRTSSTILYSYTFDSLPHHINLILEIMKLSSLLCLAIPGAVMATTTGSIPYPTCASGYYCNTTVTATSTTASAAPTYTAFEALEYPCPDDLILSCCDFVPSNRSYYNGLFDNTTHFPGCESASLARGAATGGIKSLIPLCG